MTKNSQKGFATGRFILAAALVIAVGVIVYVVTRQEQAPKQLPIETRVMEQGETTSAPLLDFTKTDYDAALKTDKLVVLYFYAAWCPICKAEFPLMQKAFDELTTDKVIGFRVNYNDDQTDNDEKDLAREFGVAYQHTKVFLKNGQRILKSPESWDEDRYISEINKVLAQ